MDFNPHETLLGDLNPTGTLTLMRHCSGTWTLQGLDPHRDLNPHWDWNHHQDFNPPGLWPALGQGGQNTTNFYLRNCSGTLPLIGIFTLRDFNLDWDCNPHQPHTNVNMQRHPPGTASDPAVGSVGPGDWLHAGSPANAIYTDTSDSLLRASILTVGYPCG